MVGPVARFIGRRLAIGLVTIWAISVISFVIIQLPPGDFVANYIAQLSMEGAAGSETDVAHLRADYGLDDPMYVRYLDWGWAVLHGDFGRSLDWGRPVKDIIGDVLGVTVLLSLAGFALSWLMALPIAIYCAVHRRSLGDYIFSTIGVIGLAIPTFLLALAALYIGFRYFNVDLGTFQSERFQDVPWSAASALDFAEHMVLPALIIAFPTSAGLIRLMRANLLDELGKPYVVTARAKGMRETVLILKYPTRVALLPFVSSIGNVLPQLVSGSVIVSLVMSLPTIGPLLLRALQAQDMFLASTITLMLGVLTVIGTLISDLLLAWLDPRIRLPG
jgi:peptide/nickel transport system permease protein